MQRQFIKCNRLVQNGGNYPKYFRSKGIYHLFTLIVLHKVQLSVVSAKSGRRVGRPFREGSRPNQEVHQGWIALFSAHSNRDFPLFAILFGGYSGGEDTSVKIQVAIVYGECGTHFSVVCFAKKPPRVSVLNHHITK